MVTITAGAGVRIPSRSRARVVRGSWEVARWVVRTVAIVVPVFLFASFATFVLGAVSGLSPAGLKLGDAATAADVARVNAQFGLNQPLVIRYVTWLGQILHGDLGTSWFNNLPVAAQLFERLGISVSIAGFALLIGVTAGFSLGLLAAVKRGSWVDRLVTATSTVISTLPPFVVAIVLIIVFCVTLRWLPSAGYVDPSVNFWEWLSLITLPAIALSLDTVADLARQLRTGLVSAYEEHYVTGAIVRGFSRRRVLFVHVLRNGAGPALSVLGLRAPALLGGAVVTESIFGMEGFGRFASESALRGDVPVVQGVLVVSIVLVLGFNLVVNALLARLLPATRKGL
ncbi:MAG: ABC-type transporter, integral rane subunit [Glaciihabitans sp.]|nr:ABC-type transporter, integral rane subunit [Glaciihabitans sp.]